ncbi:MAG: SpoIIIAC/SpoIIIAD family protein [Eubacteriales bacterium]|nr:SpoIIIAC/SpoIIIAD family protein [Eubacteriales bacterium]
MQMLRILVLCLSAALICMTLRAAHPQIAAAVAMAAGVAALMLSGADLGGFARTLQTLEDCVQAAGQPLYLLKICGIAMIAEFASDICRDAGEAALARRIDVGVRIGIVASALPAAAEIMESIAALLA